MYNLNLIQLIQQWAQVAYNWIKNFLKIVWGFIQSYWPKLKSLLKEWLEEYIEVVVLDGREIGGREMIKTLTEARPSEISLEDIYGLVTLGVTSSNSIAKVGDLEAEVQQQDQYDSMAHQNNGILRINS
jgi:hypothetical protein